MENFKKILIISVLAGLVGGCSEIEPKPFEPSPAHINKDRPIVSSEIPKLVEQTPILPEPEVVPDLEKYTVVVNEVPVKELLFALARDAEINVDIAPDIEGVVTINAVEQTLPQILSRLSNQVEMRYEFSDNNLIISKDQPFFRSYKLDYVNMARNTQSQITIATQISTTGSGDIGDSGGSSGSSGGGNNNSLTDVTSVSQNDLWKNLILNIMAIIGEDISTSSGENEFPISNNVITSPETGIITVKASSKDHDEIQRLIDKVTDSANRQVMVQATIVEVTLNDRYQAGIDWSFVDTMAGLSASTIGLTGTPLSLLGGAFTGLSGAVFSYSDDGVGEEGDALTASVSLLKEFGDARVLSSPQMMVLNNQTAVLKVVENLVYFEVDAETTTNNNVAVTTVDTTAKTVPVGIVMSITPYISESDTVILNVRPTISRTIGTGIRDPNPNIPANIPNLVPQIAVREMESMLRMNNGQIAVLGGLMTDETSDIDRGIPGAADVPVLDKIFSTDTITNTKTELVIFLRPVIVRNPSLDGDLELYQPYLEQNTAIPSIRETGES